MASASFLEGIDAQYLKELFHQALRSLPPRAARGCRRVQVQLQPHQVYYEYDPRKLPVYRLNQLHEFVLKIRTPSNNFEYIVKCVPPAAI